MKFGVDLEHKRNYWWRWSTTCKLTAVMATVRILESFGLWRSVGCYKITDVSDERTVFIVSEVKMGVVLAPYTRVNFNQTTRRHMRKTVIFIVIAVSTSHWPASAYFFYTLEVIRDHSCNVGWGVLHSDTLSLPSLW